MTLLLLYFTASTAASWSIPSWVFILGGVLLPVFGWFGKTALTAQINRMSYAKSLKGRVDDLEEKNTELLEKRVSGLEGLQRDNAGNIARLEHVILVNNEKCAAEIAEKNKLIAIRGTEITSLNRIIADLQRMNSSLLNNNDRTDRQNAAKDGHLNNTDTHVILKP